VPDDPSIGGGVLSDGREVLSGLDYYRVQSDKRWWRRKWQAEWDGCRWAQRGYTRPGIRAVVRVRPVSDTNLTLPTLDTV